MPQLCPTGRSVVPAVAESATSTMLVKPTLLDQPWVRLTEGELYSARGIKLSRRRLQGLGFFEDIQFEMRPSSMR